MSSYDSDDDYFYHEYDGLAWYIRRKRPPSLVTKKSQLLAAVVKNKVDVLRDLLDSPEWYNVTDKSGKTLLEIAILTENKEVFDYMMSIPDFPIDYIDDEYGYTALSVALGGFRTNWTSQHFAYELIKKGASINLPFSEGNTALHCALDRWYNKVAMLLIEKGVDVNIPNKYGETPIELALGMDKGVEEVVPALLAHGAMPSVDTLTYSVPFSIQEQLFLYIFDECAEVDVDLHIILELAETKSPLFHELFKYNFRVSICDSAYQYFRMLSSLDIDYLRIIVEKFYTDISEAFAKVEHDALFCMPNIDCVNFMENLDLMLASTLRSDVISIISSRGVNLFEDDDEVISLEIERITELCCYLMSYGFLLTERDLNKIYKKFGHSELFKIFLHMDIRMTVEKRTKEYKPAALFYDITLDLDRFFQHPDSCHWNANDVRELCKNFVHPRLKERYSDLVQTKKIGNRDLPDVPLLTELARNVFRKYFIKSYQIKTSRKFYILLNRLPISIVHKKIVSYETKLYRYIL